MSKVRVRFAPSPTGFLHVGGLRTALFNFLFARHHKGDFILRIEDTDKSREVAGALENIVETLKFFKLGFDEGPTLENPKVKIQKSKSKGGYGPYFQSQRLEIYKKHADELIAKGIAYKCFCSGERIAELKKQAELLKQPFRYDKHCLKNPEQTGKTFVIRQNVPEEGFTEFDDIVYGHIKVENRLLDDGVLLKSDSWPVYNFANVIDDHLMEISHVIRGEEFVPSTPKHILLYQAFGWQPPKFAHLPLLLDKSRQKLSKRSGDTAVREYTGKGYLPEALLNFVAFLGWNPKTEQEIFSLDELIRAFDLEKVNKSGAVFDIDKLNWFNAHYIKQRDVAELTELVKPHLPPESKDYPEDFLQKIVEIERERLNMLSEIGERVGYFFRKPEYEKTLLRWKDMSGEDIKNSLQNAEKVISNFPASPAGGQFPISKEKIQTVFFNQIGEGDKGKMLWPLRVALTGLKASPGPFEILEVFLSRPEGKKEVLARIQNAIVTLRGDPPRAEQTQ